MGILDIGGVDFGRDCVEGGKKNIFEAMKVEVIGNKCGRLCVFNCLDTERGLEIAREMLAWLTPIYEVHVVHHDGSKYEYWGLCYLKELVEKSGRPCLYLHTKGAANSHKGYSDVVRELWKIEFGDEEKARMYFDIAERIGDPVVVAPVIDTRRIPLWNGFVVNAAVMERTEFKESNDRYVYERMWVKDKDVILIPLKYYGRLDKMNKFLSMEIRKPVISDRDMKIKMFSGGAFRCKRQ